MNATQEELELIWQHDWACQMRDRLWVHRWMPWRLAKDARGGWWLVENGSGRQMNQSHDLRVLLVHAALLAGGPPQ